MFFQFGKGKALTTTHTWAKNKAVLTQFMVPFNGRDTEEIKKFIENPDERAVWARRLSVQFDGMPSSDQARTIIDTQVGRNLEARRRAFCEVIKQIAEELLGQTRPQLTAKAW